MGSNNNFDKNKVLEKILEEAPILSNRRGEIIVERESKDDLGKKFIKKEKRTIYAYYSSGEVRDPDLAYDKVNSPIKTTPGSTLAEVYSFWEGDPNVQALRKRLEKEGDIKKGEIIYRGPWVEHTLDDKETIEKVRDGFWDYIFHRSASVFERHFNKISEELDYDLRLIDLAEERYEFFYSGAYAVQSPKMIPYSLGSKIKENLMDVRVPVNINLNRVDPTLSEILNIVDESYKKIQDTDFSDGVIWLK